MLLFHGSQLLYSTKAEKKIAEADKKMYFSAMKKIMFPPGHFRVERA
jgi:hypothetical protein